MARKVMKRQVDKKVFAHSAVKGKKINVACRSPRGGIRFQCMYTAIIEDPDGLTYEQSYKEFEDLVELANMLGKDYWIVDIYQKGKINL